MRTKAVLFFLLLLPVYVVNGQDDKREYLKKVLDNLEQIKSATCAFGGKKMDTLYITTARAGLSEEQLRESPLSGSVFCCKPGVKGVRANCFGE